VRPYASRTPLIDKASAVPLAPPDLDGNNVRYDWGPSDMATLGEGDVFAWWWFQIPGAAPQETPEFPLLITDHGPGLGTQTGAIVDGAARFLPVTFDYLQRDTRFGDRMLQRTSSLVQQKVLGYVTPVDQEDQIPDVLLDWLSKRVAIDLITPGIDYWSRQLRTATSSGAGGNEVSAFPDMIRSLQDLRVTLAGELAEDWRQVQLLVPGTPNRKVVPMPASTYLDPLRPWLTPRVTKDPQVVQPLLTGWVPWSFGSLGAWPFP
jgi:hypothetical protein